MNNYHLIDYSYYLHTLAKAMEYSYYINFTNLLHLSLKYGRIDKLSENMEMYRSGHNGHDSKS